MLKLVSITKRGAAKSIRWVCAGIVVLAVWLGGVVNPSWAATPDEACESTAHVSLADRTAAALRQAGLPDSVVIMLISTLPIIELRGGVPAGHTLMMPRGREVSWGERLRVSARIFMLAVVGNMIPVPFILWLLGPAANWCSRWSIGRRFFEWLFARTRRKSAEVEKYETLGLTIFVAVPLPATGAWTGAMVAFILGMSFRHAIVSILAGVLIAGVIMTVLSLMGWLGAAVAGVVLLGMAVGAMLKWLQKEPSEANSLQSKEANLER